MTIDAHHWQERLDALAARHGVPGAQLGILRLPADGAPEGAPDELVELAHGVLHTGTGAPVRTDSLFQIGSITKVYTVTLAMRLVDEGLLGLDVPVVEAMPELRLHDPDVTAALTLRHLVTHTSGLDGDVFTDTGRGDDCLARFVELLGDVEQNHPLGATWSYCNSGFTLLGRLVERVTGQTWDQALRERLLTPLGLRSTVTLPEEALLHSVAVGHFDGRPVPVWALPRSTGPAGVVNARVADVLAFARLHLTGGRAPDGTRVLGEESVAAMAAHEVDLPDPHRLGDSWGLGWIRYGWSGHRLVGHDGNTVGQAAFLRVLPEQRLAVALLTNDRGPLGLYEDLYRELFSELAGVDLPPRFGPPTTPYDADVTADLGTYERAGCRHSVERGPDGLRLRTTLLGQLAALSPQVEQVQPLVPVAHGLYAAGVPDTDLWVSVAFYELATGERYIHAGARAARKVAT